MPPQSLFVITAFVWDDDHDTEGLHEPEVYSSKNAANAAAKARMIRFADMLNPLGDMDDWNFYHNLDDEGLYRGHIDGGAHGHVACEICVFKVGLNARNTRVKAKKQITEPGNVVKAEDGDDDDEMKNEEDDEEDNEDEDEDGDEKPTKVNSKSKKKTPAAAPKKKALPAANKTGLNAAGQRKTIPKGIPDCLEGVKILFTGTFQTMDRVTSIATAKKYGADVVTKLEDTDYIVIGIRAGPKKLQTINELELETISEEEFFDILENGLSQDKRERMANKRLADEEEEPEDVRDKAAAKAKSNSRKRVKR